jgi:ABC-type transport system substrate-binding protein
MMPWAFMHAHDEQQLGADGERRAAAGDPGGVGAGGDRGDLLGRDSTGGIRRWQYPGTTYFPGMDGLDAFVKQNQAKAKQLLAAAGYKGEEFVVIADSSNKWHLDAGTVAAEQLRAIGLKVKLNVTDWPTVNAARLKPDGWNLWPLAMGIEPYEGPVQRGRVLLGLVAGADQERPGDRGGQQEARHPAQAGGPAGGGEAVPGAGL